jgi:hypothetical protein
MEKEYCRATYDTAGEYTVSVDNYHHVEKQKSLVVAKSIVAVVPAFGQTR